MKTHTDPKTGQTLVLLTDAHRNALARAKDICVQITIGEHNTPRSDAASEAADALGTLLGCALSAAKPGEQEMKPKPPKS